MLLKVNQDEVVNQSLKNKTMSKYQLENLLNEIAGTGRIGTYIATYRELVNKVDELEEKGIKVKELGMSGDGKTPFEFEIYPGDKDEAFSVYPYKFDPSDGDDMEIHRFSIGGKPVAIRVAKELLGQGAYSNAEIRDGLDQLDDAGDDTSDFGDLREDKEKDLINALRFHYMSLEKGIIDKDDFINAVEELAFGPRKAPGMNTDDDFEREQRMQMGMREEDVIEDEPVTEDSIEESDNPEVDALLGKIRKHLKGSDRNFQDNEIEMYIDSLDRDIKRGDFDGVESISMEDHEEDLENYIADKSLQEHFGRFMKDYQ